MLSAPPATRVLPVFMAHGNGDWRTFNMLYLNCPHQQLLLCTAVVIKEMRPESNMKVCNRITSNSKEPPRRVSTLDNEIFVPRLCLCAPPLHQ